MAGHRDLTAGRASLANEMGSLETMTASVVSRNDPRVRPSTRRVATVNLLLIVLPVLVTISTFLEFSSVHQIAFDFHHDFWVAGFRVVHGLSPYSWSRAQIAAGFSFPYPAPAALLFVPFSLLPRGLSDLSFVALSLAACLSALRVLNVRDWRPYTAVLLWLPVINAWQTANVTLLLVCGVAVVWRYRDSPVVAGAVLGLMLSVKPVVWPVLLWLAITRRRLALAYALGCALVVNVICWGTLGFGQLSGWWHLLGRQADVVYGKGYALTALSMHLGAGRATGWALQAFATTAIAACCLRLARNRREREAFTLAIGLILVASPQIDNHYFALLVVPFAMVRPRFSPAWLAPLVLWLCPAAHAAGWQVAVAWTALSAITLWVIRSTGRPGESAVPIGGFPGPRFGNLRLEHRQIAS